MVSFFLHPGGQNCFFQLAGKLLFRGQQHGLGNLLGNGRGPLFFAEVNDVLDHCPDNTQIIEPLVLVEIRVFCRHKSLNQAARYLVDLNDRPALQVELADQAAVITKNLGNNRRLVVSKPVNLRQ